MAHPQPIQAPIPTSAGPSASFNRPPITSTPVQNDTPRPVSAVAGSVGSTLQRPGSTVPRPGSTVANQTLGRPGSTVSKPGSTVPRPGSTKPVLAPVQVLTGRVGTPLRTGGTGPGTPLRSAGTATPTSAVQNSFGYPMDQDKRGKKRDRDDHAGVAVNGLPNINGNGNIGVVNSHTNPPLAITNARAGMAGIRPRPVKKQRMVSAFAFFSYSLFFLPLSLPFGGRFMYPFWWLTLLSCHSQDIQGQARDVTVTQQPTPQGV
jgi:hypothetical protein